MLVMRCRGSRLACRSELDNLLDTFIDMDGKTSYAVVASIEVLKERNSHEDKGGDLVPLASGEAAS